MKKKNQKKEIKQACGSTIFLVMSWKCVCFVGGWGVCVFYFIFIYIFFFKEEWPLKSCLIGLEGPIFGIWLFLKMEKNLIWEKQLYNLTI